MAGRRQPGIESTQVPSTNTVWSPLFGNVTLTDYQKAAQTPGTKENKALQRGAEKGRKELGNFIGNEMLGLDDFRRASQAGNMGEFLKSAGTGALELGLTFSPGVVFNAGKFVAKPALLAAGKVAAPVAGAVARGFDTVAREGAKRIAPALAAVTFFSGASGAVPRAVDTAFDASRPAVVKLVTGGKEAVDKGVDAIKQGADESVKFVQGVKESVEQTAEQSVGAVKQKADDAVDFVKDLFGPTVNAADVAPDVKPYNYQQEQQQQQQQSASGTGETGSGRPTDPEGTNKPRRNIPGLPDFSIKAGEDIKLPYTY